jgi:lysyl-tRNA synthetase class 2
MSIPFIEENDQTIARHQHLDALRELVGNVYPNKFERSEIVEPGKEDTITAIVEKFRGFEPQEELTRFIVRIAGRIASPPRVMGKTAFVHLSDGVSRLQIYIRKNEVTGVRNDAQGGEVDGWAIFQQLDHGDFIGVEGFLFVTKTGELSVHVQKLQFLSKALLPLPDKMHGIHDPEIRQRQRYADLIAGSLKHEKDDSLTPREVFERRAAAVKEMRQDSSQRARHRLVCAHCPGVVPEASAGRWLRKGLRAQSKLSQRRHFVTAQSRVHDARVLLGVCRRERDDRFL